MPKSSHTATKRNEIETICSAVIIAYRAESKAERHPEIFRVLYCTQRECSCSGDKVKATSDVDAHDLRFPEGPLIASNYKGGRSGEKQTVYFTADVTRSEIPSNSKARKASMASSELLSDSFKKRTRYVNAVETKKIEYYTKLIEPYLESIMLAALKEIEWEQLCLHGTLKDWRGGQCDQIVQRIRSSVELFNSLEPLSNVTTYKVPGSRVVVVLKVILFIIISGEPMASTLLYLLCYMICSMTGIFSKSG